jgi:DNA-binding NtrC family response regulator
MARTRSVLIVDDDPRTGSSVAGLLACERIGTTLATTVDEALGALARQDFDAVLSDVRMPGRSGIELVGEVRELRPDTPVVLMTGFASVDAAVEAMRAGAFDYLTKPVRAEELLLSLEHAFEVRTLEAQTRARETSPGPTALGDMVGQSPALRGIFALIERVADSRSHVLISGESGTGKELVARLLHETSRRADQPFVPVNCAAIPEGLLETELFGHVRGAFTGAVAAKEGLFQLAGSGTLFLDEIGDIPLGLQAKLLRALEQREVRRVGGSHPERVDARVVVATHRDLRGEIEAGRFRRDLYYRLNVIPIRIPPLRERPEDIPCIAEAFVARAAGAEGRRLAPEALELLAAQPWEGNARELENTLERALLLSDAPVLGPADLRALLAGPPGAEPPAPVTNHVEALAAQGMPLREVENQLIREVLKRTGGNKVEAARRLGISRRTIYRRCEEDPGLGDVARG